ncbi:MAG: hypothetical protein KAT77_04055 [Nanoarchaeota archaeon]|nr:hypothetical protein [Nanoarchaeota archaeon]
MFEHEMAGLLGKIISGERVMEKAGDWQFQSRKDDFLFHLIHPKAEYAFEICESEGGAIKFSNYHRRAEKGNGTATLKHVEAAIQILSNEQRKPVRVIFEELGGQTDTVQWLEKNGYVSMTGEKYIKYFNPDLP